MQTLRIFRYVIVTAIIAGLFFTGCEEEQNSVTGEVPELVSVDVNNTNTEATLYFSKGAYKNEDGSGALDSASLDLSIAGGDASISSLSVEHKAGSNEATLNIGLSVDETTGDEQLTVEVSKGSIYSEEGLSIVAGSVSDNLAQMEGETDIVEKLMSAYAESGELPADNVSLLKSNFNDNNNAVKDLGYEGDATAEILTFGENTSASAPSGDFFTDVSYKGAFNKAGDNWANWTLTYDMASVTYDYANNVTDTVVISDNITSDKTFSATTLYKLNGFVFVTEGATLTIEAGTMIQGKPGQGENASALIIEQDGKIMAEGTAQKPIVFTGEGDNYQGSEFTKSVQGLWGGVIVLGEATTNNSTQKRVEGIPESYEAYYGGDDDADNSGVIKYISIRHGGTDIGAGNEINGLTLAGVGNGTTLEYIEVISNVDDGVEWFGGAANTKYLLTAYCGDDSYDYDEGFHGKGQFWVTIQADGVGDRCGEHDGGSGDDEASSDPYAKPQIYNATYIGNGSNKLITFRDNAGGTYANSIFVNHGNGIAVEYRDDKESSSYDMLKNGHLVIKDNIFHNVAGSN